MNHKFNFCFRPFIIYFFHSALKLINSTRLRNSYFPTKTLAASLVFICFNQFCFAASVAEELWKLNIEGGFIQMDFADINGADSSRISNSIMAISLSKPKDFWNFGVRYSNTTGVIISSFKLSDGQTGSYRLEFQRWQALIGLIVDKFKTNFIYGPEWAAWKGTPGLGTKSYTILYGIDFSYDIYSPMGGKGGLNFTIPLRFEIMSLPKRNYDFQNFPLDSVSAKSGFAYSLMTGVEFAF